MYEYYGGVLRGGYSAVLCREEARWQRGGGGDYARDALRRREEEGGGEVMDSLDCSILVVKGEGEGRGGERETGKLSGLTILLDVYTDVLFDVF